VLFQLANEGLGGDLFTYPFRCIGMRTDMKAKVFEWIDSGFDVPVDLIHDVKGSDEVRQAIDFATDCAGIIASTFRMNFGGEGKTERRATLRHRMVDAYWAALADPFRNFVLAVPDPKQQEVARLTWIERVVYEANDGFKTYSEAVGNDAAALRERVTGRRICAARLYKKRKEAVGEQVSADQDKQE
jgi:CRISPR system Cascade subunit CasA